MFAFILLTIHLIGIAQTGILPTDNQNDHKARVLDLVNQGFDFR